MINSTIQRDKKQELLDKTLEKGMHQNRMLRAIKKCGITFNIWLKSDENGYATDKYDWTSLMGMDKKKLLKSLPQYFEEYISSATLSTVTKIWQDFQKVYDVLNAWSPTEDSTDFFFEQVNNVFTITLGDVSIIPPGKTSVHYENYASFIAGNQIF